MNTKESIALDWLKRYTGTSPSEYGDWILLTNFQNYVENYEYYEMKAFEFQLQSMFV